MKNSPNCPLCHSEYTYENAGIYVCPECAHEWVEDLLDNVVPTQIVVRDMSGNELHNGDSVVVVKDIKVKGSSSVIKMGLKLKDIRLVEEVNGHNFEAKVPGLGQMLLKSELVKKSV